MERTTDTTTAVETGEPLAALQYADLCDTEEDARAGLDFLAIQVDYLGGRVLAPSVKHPKQWRIQVFFSADGVPDGTAWLPDGMRRVLVPVSTFSRLGIRS